MTTPDAAQFMDGTITALGDVRGGRKVTILRPNMKYPDSFNFFGDYAKALDETPGIVVGAAVRIDYEVSDKLNSTGKPYRNGVGIDLLGQARGQMGGERIVLDASSLDSASPGRPAFQPLEQHPGDPRQTSIEAQVALKKAWDVVIAASMLDATILENLEYRHSIQELVRDLTIFNVAVLNEGRTHLAEMLKSSSPPWVEVPQESPQEKHPLDAAFDEPAKPRPPTTPDFKRPGDLFNAAWQRWKKNSAAVMDALKVDRPESISNLGAAWKALEELWGKSVT